MREAWGLRIAGESNSGLTRESNSGVTTIPIPLAGWAVLSVCGPTAAHPLQCSRLAGHSLGGALATLAAYDIAKAFPSFEVSCYTFGAPR